MIYGGIPQDCVIFSNDRIDLYTNVQLHEQILVLKQELWHIEHNIEREKYQDSMKYLEKVLMKFLTYSVAGHNQDKLIEVLTAILKLTVDERQQLMKTTQPSHIPDHLRSWVTYLILGKPKSEITNEVTFSFE